MRLRFALLLIALVYLANPVCAAEPIKPIELETTVKASRSDAWQAWATSAGAEKWFAKKANIELKPGGAYEILFSPEKPKGERGAEDLKVLCFLPEEMLAFEWSAPPQFQRARPQRTCVIVRFTDLGDGTTRVRLTHDGFAEKARAKPAEAAEWAEVREYFAKAWPMVMGMFEKQFSKEPMSSDRQVTDGIVEASISEVWAAFTTKKGVESWQVAHAEIDFRVGGKMQSHYDAKGVIGDPNTIENLILAYEPNKFLSMQVGKAPEKFPFKEAVKKVWHVIYLDDAGPGRTRVRIVGQGYGSDEESRKMQQFFEAGNSYTLKKLQEHFARK